MGHKQINNTMEKIEITVYEFDELHTDVQDRMINDFIGSSFDYWDDAVIQQAKFLGIEIEEYDIRRHYIKLTLNSELHKIADEICKEYCPSQSITILSKQFLEARDLLVKKYSDGINTDRVSEENEYDFDKEYDGLEFDFQEELEGEILNSLQKEYDYYTSREYAVEMLIDGRYTEDGHAID